MSTIRWITGFACAAFAFGGAGVVLAQSAETTVEPASHIDVVQVDVAPVELTPVELTPVDAAVLKLQEVTPALDGDAPALDVPALIGEQPLEALTVEADSKISSEVDSAIESGEIDSGLKFVDSGLSLAPEAVGEKVDPIRQLTGEGKDLSMIPEPNTVVMLLLSALLLFLWRRKW